MRTASWSSHGGSVELVVRVHRDKLFRAPEMLADGETVREVAGKLGRASLSSRRSGRLHYTRCQGLESC